MVWGGSVAREIELAKDYVRMSERRSDTSETRGGIHSEVDGGKEVTCVVFILESFERDYLIRIT